MFKTILKIICFFVILTFIFGIEILPIAITVALALTFLALVGFLALKLLLFIFPTSKNKETVKYEEPKDVKKQQSSRDVPGYVYYFLASDRHPPHHH